MDFKTLIAQQLEKPAGIERTQLEDMLETPPEPGMGDYALPCFKLAKLLHKAPAAIAAELAEAPMPDFVARTEAAGGYLNLFIKPLSYAKAVMEDIRAEGESYGGSNEGAGRHICIDYSSINIAKPFHIGHLSTTVIGNALYKIYEFMGYKCIGINHLGDWGTQFGKLITAYKLWGVRAEIEKEGTAGLTKLYVRFHEEAEHDPELDEAARAWFKKIEDGDKEALELFEWFKSITLKDVARVYDILGITFDSYAGESFYNDKMDRVVDEIKAKNLLEYNNGAYIVNLESYNMPPCIILKADGATLYATRDIAAALYRKDTYDFYKALYVVAYQQNLHFKQVFKVIELMGYAWASQLEHVAFGMVSMEDGTLSTRKGRVILLEDVLNKSIEKTFEIIKEKSPELENKEEVARQVGVGAIVWNALYGGRIKDVVFSWDKALNFDGETGPYAQYTHARCCSVLRKAAAPGDEIDYSKLCDPEALALLHTLARFPEAVRSACEKNEPYLVTRYVIALCQEFNKFYYEHRIIDDDRATSSARLALTEMVRARIAKGLALIGLSAPERM
jgi:arginyl-tRNA synthetase